MDEDAHQVDQVDEHAQTHQEDAHTQEPADDEEARALQGEAEADEDDDQQEDTAGGSGSSSVRRAYLIGPRRLYARSLDPLGKRMQLLHFFCYYV